MRVLSCSLPRNWHSQMVMVCQPSEASCCLSVLSRSLLRSILSFQNAVLVFGRTKYLHPLVTVPKTTVHEDYSAVLAEHKVGMSGKSGIKQPVTETVGKQEFPHYHFRPGIPAPYCGHAFVPLFSGHPVHCHPDFRSYLLLSCLHLRWSSSRRNSLTVAHFLRSLRRESFSSANFLSKARISNVGDCFSSACSENIWRSMEYNLP